MRPSSLTLKEPPKTSDIPDSVRDDDRQSSKSASETPDCRPRASRVSSTTSCSELGNGKLRRRTALTIVKTALFAPIPRASTTAAMAVNQRSLRRRRTA
jgi:hypothetical protein